MFAMYWEFILRNESKAPDDQTVNRLLAVVQLKVLVGTHFHKNSRPSSKVHVQNLSLILPYCFVVGTFSPPKACAWDVSSDIAKNISQRPKTHSVWNCPKLSLIVSWLTHQTCGDKLPRKSGPCQHEMVKMRWLEKFVMSTEKSPVLTKRDQKIHQILFEQTNRALQLIISKCQIAGEGTLPKCWIFIWKC